MEHDFIKLFTPTFFKREKFAEVLIEDCQVPCAVQEDGLVFDRALLHDIATRVDLPAWIWAKWNDIFSPWHTREAQRGEWPDDISFPPRYSVTCSEGMTEWSIGTAFTFNRAKKIADACANDSENINRVFFVLDEQKDREPVYAVYSDPSIEEFVHSITNWTQIA